MRTSLIGQFDGFGALIGGYITDPSGIDLEDGLFFLGTEALELLDQE